MLPSANSCPKQERSGETNWGRKAVQPTTRWRLPAAGWRPARTVHAEHRGVDPDGRGRRNPGKRLPIMKARLQTVTVAGESHPAMAGHSGAAYNPGMDDAQTLTTIPSGPRRSPADEPPAASLRRSEEDEPPPAPATLPPELPASPPPAAAESPAFSPPAELPLSELEFTGCKPVRMTPYRSRLISAGYDTNRISLGLGLVPARKPHRQHFSYAGMSNAPSVVQTR